MDFGTNHFAANFKQDPTSRVSTKRDERTSKLSRLCKIFRIEDGKTYYCFSEVKTKLFPEIPQGTVKTWIRHFKIFKSKCNPEEHSYFKNRIPEIAQGAFKLISENDVMKLLDYCDSKETSPSKKAKVLNAEDSQIPSTLSSQSDLRERFDIFSSQNSQNQYNLSHFFSPQKEPLVVEVKESQLQNIGNIDEGIREKSTQQATNSTYDIPCTDSKVAQSVVENYCCDESSDEENGDDSSAEEENLCAKDKFKFKHRTTRKLKLSEIDQHALFELEHLKSFFSRPLNPQRNGNSCKPATILKLQERILVFYKFLKSEKGFSSPELRHIENGELVQEFCEYLLSSNRKLKSITVSRYLSSFIKVYNFLHREESIFNQEKSDCLSKIRSLQRQLEFDGRREAKCSKENKTTIHYEEILMVARKLLHDFEDQTTAIDKARALMDFCVVLLYTNLTGRCKEFVSLRITDSKQLAESSEGNFLVNEPESKLVLICRDYKTSKVYGTDKTVLENSHLEYYLRIYIDNFRTKLLQGNCHDYFLVNFHGNPFSVPSFNKYVGRIFEKYCDAKVGMNDLRHSLVTYFLTLPDSGNEKLSESLATVMRHSVRAQRQFYDKRTSAEKKQPALSFLARTAKNAIFDDEEIAFSVSQIDKEGFTEDSLPVVGDLVALVASNSTRNSPQIFLAKVLRFSDNKKDVLLAHMEEICDNMFRLVIGKSYLESTNSLIFPIDVVFKTSDRVYELRSNKLELHNETNQ